MKSIGRSTQPLTEEEKKAIIEFLNNDLSYEEQGKKLGLTKAQFRYRVAKYRKEQEENYGKKTNE